MFYEPKWVVGFRTVDVFWVGIETSYWSACDFVVWEATDWAVFDVSIELDAASWEVTGVSDVEVDSYDVVTSDADAAIVDLDDDGIQDTTDMDDDNDGGELGGKR